MHAEGHADSGTETDDAAIGNALMAKQQGETSDQASHGAGPDFFDKRLLWGRKQIDLNESFLFSRSIF